MKIYKDDKDENKKDTFDEYSTRDHAPVVKSFADRHGYDERDGPPEEDGQHDEVNG